MNDEQHECGLTAEQVDALLRPLNSQRVATRKQSGKDLSYLESWDVKRCLIRVFGFTGFDSEVISEEFINEYPYTSVQKKQGNDVEVPMLEIVYRARVQLKVKCRCGNHLATYSEGSVGSATVSAASGAKGDAHDNALKTAASDALKRCAINLGTQFGLSLYNHGDRNDVVGMVLVNGVPPVEQTDEQKAALERSLNATKVDEPVTPTEETADAGAAK